MNIPLNKIPVILALSAISFLPGCKKKEELVPNPEHLVRYYAAWHGFEMATCYYHWLKYKAGDSIFTYDPFYLMPDGTITREFKAKLHDTLWMTFGSYQPYGSTHSDTLKIFYNNVLVSEGSESCMYVVDR